MEAKEVRRGMRVVFWPDSDTFGEPNKHLTGKVKGIRDPEFPYIFVIKADNGRTYEVNARLIFMRLP